jgi:integrase
MSKRRHFGTIRQLGSGRWQVRYTGPDGLMHAAPHTFPRKQDAVAWLAQAEYELMSGDWIDPNAGRVTLREYGRAWLRERAGISDRTREAYEDLLRLHILPPLGSSPVNAIREATIRRWRTDLLESGVGGPTVAKSYRLLRAILYTAVDDGLIRRNPCRIQGAGEDTSPERPILTIPEVYAVADAIGPRYRALVLLGTFASLRFGELAALRRSDVEVDAAIVTVNRSLAELGNGRLVTKTPKSAAGTRRVALPEIVLHDLTWHLDRFAERGRQGLVFVGPQGGPLRRHAFRKRWTRALADAGVEPVHFHDLRHTGNTLAAATGASTRELMTRMGHSSSRAAMIYQHSTSERDRLIADAINPQVLRLRQPPEPPIDDASGT